LSNRSAAANQRSPNKPNMKDAGKKEQQPYIPCPKAVYFKIKPEKFKGSGLCQSTLCLQLFRCMLSFRKKGATLDTDCLSYKWALPIITVLLQEIGCVRNPLTVVL